MEVSVIGLALGAVVGLILALTGAGGGILAVPLLVFGLHLSIMQAAPVGLIAVGCASAIGAVLGLREGLVRYRAAAVIGLIGMALAPVGVRMARIVPNGPLTVAFAAVLFYVAARMLLQAHRAGGVHAEASRSSLPCVLNPVEGRLAWTMPCARALAATGAVSGLLSGLLLRDRAVADPIHQPRHTQHPGDFTRRDCAGLDRWRHRCGHAGLDQLGRCSAVRHRRRRGAARRTAHRRQGRRLAVAAGLRDHQRPGVAAAPGARDGVGHGVVAQIVSRRGASSGWKVECTLRLDKHACPHARWHDFER